jgi:hypothetical protein
MTGPLELTVLAGLYAVSRLGADDPIPEWATGQFLSITRTREELSIVSDEATVPPGIRTERSWRCLQLRGPIPFEVTGVAASLTAALADAGISLFLLATFDTDYVLVHSVDLERSLTALRAAGYTVNV